jgi:hypothetical protein
MIKKKTESRVFTIWKYGIQFYSSKQALRSNSYFGEHIYAGLYNRIPRKIAEDVAEIAPKYEKYFEYAMTPLYKWYGKSGRGTECPISSIQSLVRKSLLDKDEFKYVKIWKIFYDYNFKY